MAASRLPTSRPSKATWRVHSLGQEEKPNTFEPRSPPHVRASLVIVVVWGRGGRAVVVAGRKNSGGVVVASLRRRRCCCCRRCSLPLAEAPSQSDTAPAHPHPCHAHAPMDKPTICTPPESSSPVVVEFATPVLERTRAPSSSSSSCSDDDHARLSPASTLQFWDENGLDGAWRRRGDSDLQAATPPRVPWARLMSLNPRHPNVELFDHAIVIGRCTPSAPVPRSQHLTHVPQYVARQVCHEHCCFVDPKISKEHCSLELVDAAAVDGVVVRDTSANGTARPTSTPSPTLSHTHTLFLTGTFINGRKIGRGNSTSIRTGDELSLVLPSCAVSLQSANHAKGPRRDLAPALAHRPSCGPTHPRVAKQTL